VVGFPTWVHILELGILGTVSWPADQWGKAKWDGPFWSLRWINSRAIPLRLPPLIGRPRDSAEYPKLQNMNPSWKANHIHELRRKGTACSHWDLFSISGVFIPCRGDITDLGKWTIPLRLPPLIGRPRDSAEYPKLQNMNPSWKANYYFHELRRKGTACSHWDLFSISGVFIPCRGDITGYIPTAGNENPTNTE
jgi:hypothetical protein